MMKQMIKQLRIRDRLTQKELAQALGIHANHVSALERGKCEPSPLLIQRMMDHFLVDELTLRFGDRVHPYNERDYDLTQTVKDFLEFLETLPPASQHILLGKAMQMREQGLI